MPRKQPDVFYIYKTTCTITGRYYIGMHGTANIDDGYLGSGKLLRYSIRKYGRENHIKEIVEYLPTRKLLIEREKEIITEEMICDVNCLNLMSGGTGGLYSIEHVTNNGRITGAIMKKRWETDLEWRGKVVETFSKSSIKGHELGKYRYDNFRGKNHTQESKNNISKNKKGKCIGESNSQFDTCWVTLNNVDKKIKINDLDDYINKGWVRGISRKIYNQISTDEIKQIKELYLQLKSYLKVSKKLNIAKSTVIKYVKL